MTPPPSWLPSRSDAFGFFRASGAASSYRLLLFESLARLLPQDGPLSIVDVGAGDGFLGAALARYRPDTRAIGLETQVRERRHPSLAIARYDGLRFPLSDASADVVILANVLHHAHDPAAVVREARRVARSCLLIKDHLAEGVVDHWKLALLDVLGNLRFGAPTVGSYQGLESWKRMLGSATGGSRIESIEALPFRTGLMEWLFPNRLEVVFRVQLQGP